MNHSRYCFFICACLNLFCLFACREQTKRAAVKQKGISNGGLYLPDDLQATVWAESPMLYNPTNMDVDSRGRIWITEAVNYRNYNNDSTKFFHHSKGDRVVILEDTDNDGRADTSKVFVQDSNLVAPLGIAVIGNKVIVSCSPNLIIYTDDDGDDIPDSKKVLLTGFGGKDHDHSLHAIYAGPDGNWYFNTGNAGPHTVTDKSGWTLRSGSLYTGGSPYNDKNQGNRKSDDGKVWVGGLALRIRPDGTGLRVLAHNFRNSYEVIPDSYGDLWQNDNDDQVVTCRTTWLMEGGNAGYFSEDGTRYWQADQRPGQDIFTAHWHQEDPGVMPAGDCTGAGAPTGIVVNETEALGAPYLGMLLSADAARNTIFAYHPRLAGSGFDLGKRQNLISSLSYDNTRYVWDDSVQNSRREKWFRPSDVTFGTDGAIYIADWYDPVVGGHQAKDSAAYGRIYRISPKNKILKSPRIDLSTEQGQLLALRSPAIHVRNQGFERLRQKGVGAIFSVLPLLKDPNPYVAARAVWLLSRLGTKGEQQVRNLLHDPRPRIRVAAFRALRQTQSDILVVARDLASDTSAMVRREVAISLRDLPYSKTKASITQLIKGYDGSDRWYLETLGSILKGHESDIYPVIKTIFNGEQNPEAWTRQMSSLAWRLHPIEAIPALVSRARSSKISAPDRQAAVTALAFINSKPALDSLVAIFHTGGAELSGQAAYWLSFRQGNDWYTLADWSRIGLNAAYERKLAQMKLKKPEKIFDNTDAGIRVQAGDDFKRPEMNKTFSIKRILGLPADAVKGEAVFASRCATCHKLGSGGSTIGPDLSFISNKLEKTELLDAIINPSAAIVFGYDPWLIQNKDGGSVYGFLISENEKTITIKDISGREHVIAVTSIASKAKQDKSLMPDPLTNGLTEQDLANVAAFLKSAQ